MSLLRFSEAFLYGVFVRRICESTPFKDVSDTPMLGLFFFLFLFLFPPPFPLFLHFPLPPVYDVFAAVFRGLFRMGYWCGEYAITRPVRA